MLNDAITTAVREKIVLELTFLSLTLGRLTVPVVELRMLQKFATRMERPFQTRFVTLFPPIWQPSTAESISVSIFKILAQSDKVQNKNNWNSAVRLIGIKKFYKKAYHALNYQYSVPCCAHTDMPTDAPIVTDTPTDGPVDTEAPVDTDSPVNTDSPVDTEGPDGTDAPVTDGTDSPATDSTDRNDGDDGNGSRTILASISALLVALFL